MADTAAYLCGYLYGVADLTDNVQVNQFTTGSTVKVYDMQSICSQ